MMSPDDIARHFPRYDEVSMLMMDLSFDSYRDTGLKDGMEQIDNKTLTKDCYLQGAPSMPGLLISAGMPPEFLDELAEGIREAKRGMGK